MNPTSISPTGKTSTSEAVQDYYARVLTTSADLKTSACCSTDALPEHVKKVLAEIHDEVLEKFYGCGSPIPSALDGLHVLDLGSGSGRDAFVLSKLVGEAGTVTGVDMTPDQLSVARRHVAHHAEKFGYREANVRFLEGYIEDLRPLGIADASMDLVTSNCVVNLSPDKSAVFAEIFRVLKPGGEFQFSDVFASRRVPAELREDPVFLGECLGGALYLEDFRRILADLGCREYREVARASVDLKNEDMKRRAGDLEFFSLTVRAFKLDLEDRPENFGQTARYKGGDPYQPTAFRLDEDHVFAIDAKVPVSGNTAAILSRTRFAPFFEVTGDTSRHLGPFDPKTAKIKTSCC